jgi:hypothetical protein
VVPERREDELAWRRIGEFLDEAGVQVGDLRRERPGLQPDEPAEVDP